MKIHSIIKMTLDILQVYSDHMVKPQQHKIKKKLGWSHNLS